MSIVNLFKTILSYKRLIPLIVFFEIIYFFRNSYVKSFKILNHKDYTDSIPCPFFFLYKIEKFLKQRKVKCFLDLGCGLGRSIYYLNQKNKISYIGIEQDESIFEKCKSIFKDNVNIKIINDNFMTFDFSKYNIDCFFINDPLKQISDFKNLKNVITKKKLNKDSEVFFILVNTELSKRQIYKDLNLVEFLKSGDKGYYIYSSI